MAPTVELLPRQGSSTMTSPRLKVKKAKSKDSGRTKEREAEEEESFFGDFCLNCGEPCSGPSAYCSEVCLEADATDAAIATQHYLYSPALSATSVPALISSRQRDPRESGPPSAISSSPTSSLTNSPSPASLSGDRLALLSSGPLGALPLEEEVTDLDLGEGILSSHPGSFSAFARGAISIPDEGQFRPNGYFSPSDIAKLGGTPGKSPARTVSPTDLRSLDPRSISPTDTMTAPSLPPSTKRLDRERDATVRARPAPSRPSPPSDPPAEEGAPLRPTRSNSKHAGLPALFHHAQPQPLPLNEPADVPTSPAMKATASRPSVTTVATTRREPSRPAEAARGTRSDPAVLLASTARARGRSADGKAPKQKDAKSSLVAALGSQGSPLMLAHLGGGQGRSVSDVVPAGLKAEAPSSTLEGLFPGLPAIDRRRLSAPLSLAAPETMSSSSGSSIHTGGRLGKLADWQDRIKGVFRARPSLQRSHEDSEDEMTGVALALDKSTDSVASSRRGSVVRPSSPPQARRANTTPVLRRQSVARYLVGKGHRASVSEAATAASSVNDGAATTGALPTPERSLSRGRPVRPTMMPLTDLASVAFASSPDVPRGRSRRRGVPTAAMRSRSPDRSQSKSRPLSAGPEARRTSIRQASVLEDDGPTDDEGAATEEEDEEEARGRRGRSRERSAGRDHDAVATSLGMHVAPSRPVGLYRDGYGYYS